MQLDSSAVVLVTGGASGLGAATADRLAATGAHVGLLDLPAAGERLGEVPDGRFFCPADVRDPDQVQAAVDAANQRGTLRAVVCCAGVVTPGRILGRSGPLDLDVYRQVIDINLVGTFNVLRLAALAMRENEPGPDGDRGVIVMTASVAAFEGQVGQAAYASSKGGIAALTVTAARDLAQSGIRVMTIAPGVMETPMMAGLPDETRTSLEALVPHPSRLGRPAEFGQLVESIIANPYLNGEIIRLDGALRMPPR